MTRNTTQYTDEVWREVPYANGETLDEHVTPTLSVRVDKLISVYPNCYMLWEDMQDAIFGEEHD